MGARDCNTAVSSLLSPDLSHDLVLTSGYYGAPIAAKMLARAPGRYSAVILKNPELDLTRALVEEPNIIRRTFLTQSDRFTPEEVSQVWAASPISGNHDLGATKVLLLSSGPTKVILNEVAIGALNASPGAEAAHYHTHDAGLQRRIAASWAERATFRYEDTPCSQGVPDDQGGGSGDSGSDSGGGGGGRPASSSAARHSSWPIMAAILVTFLVVLSL